MKLSVSLLLFLAFLSLAISAKADDATVVNSTVAEICNATDKAPKGWNAQSCPTSITNPSVDQCNCSNLNFTYGKFRSKELVSDAFQKYMYSSGSATVPGAAVFTSGNAFECCALCANTKNCFTWQWFPQLKRKVGGKWKQFPACYLATDKLINAAFCVKKTATYNTQSAIDAFKYRIGSNCKPISQPEIDRTNKTINDNPCLLAQSPSSSFKTPCSNGDPHFVGAFGTKFDFTGHLGRSYCLISDANVHVNVFMDGYDDERLESATAFENGKAIRNWIKEVSVLWRTSGVEHTIHLVARSGGDPTRSTPFLLSAAVDGHHLPLPRHVSHSVSPPSAPELQLTLVSQEQMSSDMEADVYTLTISNLMQLQLRLRPAHRLLRQPQDAHVHFDISILSFTPTEQVHGLLGQTYRDDHVDRAIQFQKIVQALHGPVAADGESGKGFLDGDVQSYETSSVLVPDCAFSRFSEPIASA